MGKLGGFIMARTNNKCAVWVIDGMFYSLGNIRATAKIGMLFLDFEKPNRLRLHGTASVGEDDPLIKDYPGAEMIVRVAIRNLFINCPRYVHRYQKVSASRYLPRAGCATPFAEWKRIDVLQDALQRRPYRRRDHDRGVRGQGRGRRRLSAGMACYLH